MNLSLEFDYEVHDGEYRSMKLLVNYDPGELPANCQNPDATEFSEPEVYPTCQVISACFVDSAQRVPPQLLESNDFLNELYERAAEAYRDELGAAR